MGIPGFFIWLVKKYKIITYDLDKNIDYLFLDTNCLIHPQTQKTLKMYSNWNNTFIEEKMLDNIELYFDYLVDYVKPQKAVYIAIDGVAPCAKMKHQRMRRFKSVKYNFQLNSLKKKYNIKIDKNWNNSSITPGTIFMDKLKNKFLKIINKSKYNHLEIIFSSSNTPGEGEHKILQYINSLDNIYNIVIYGLDADLIFLALASQKNNIYLLREVQHFGNNSILPQTNLDNTIQVVKNEPKYEELNYLHIDILREKLYEEIKNKLDYDIDINIYDIVNDFIFISYFIGNDFLPHIPSLDIKKSGLDIILSEYIKMINKKKKNLIKINNEEIIVNNIFLLKLLKNLSKIENNSFYSLNRKKICHSDDPYEIEKFRLDNLMFYIDDPVKLGSDNEILWKQRYYTHYFKTDNIDDICNKYFEGLCWNMKYYFHSCASWLWYYPYTHAPFISDLYKYLKSNIAFFNTIVFKLNEPVDPFIQLLSVLHPSCSYLLPHSLRYLMKDNNSPIIDLYPFKFEEDFIGKDKLWQGIPKLPNFDIDRIKNNVSYNEISKKDMDRNKIEDVYIKLKYK